MHMIIARLYFAVLACVWGVLVIGFHQTLGYEKAYGYPPLAESIGWGFLLASPFFVGALFLSGTSRPAMVPRLLAAAITFGQLYFMLFVGWVWDIRMIFRHILDGTFLNAFFIGFRTRPTNADGNSLRFACCPRSTALSAAQPIHQPGRCAMKPRSAGYVRRSPRTMNCKDT